MRDRVKATAHEVYDHSFTSIRVTNRTPTPFPLIAERMESKEARKTGTCDETETLSLCSPSKPVTQETDEPFELRTID